MTVTRYEALDEALARLRPHDATAERVERVRQRCHAALARRAPEPAAGSGRAALIPIGALGVCSIYLAAAVQVSVAFLRAVSR